jgi:uncharacterized membrane protein
MGFWDSIVGDEKSDDAKQATKKSINLFTVGLKFSPLRLTAMKKNSVDLLVSVKNISPETHLVSVDALLPREAMVGFDEACINKGVEKRTGELRAGESIDVPVRIWANNQTKEGTYPINVTVYSHYIGYDKVLSYTKKSTSLRAV